MSLLNELKTSINVNSKKKTNKLGSAIIATSFLFYLY